MPETKIVVVAVFLLVIFVGGLVFWQTQSNNNPISPQETPITPQKNPLDRASGLFTVTKTTADPSNVTHGLVTITVDVENKGSKDGTVSVVMQIKEPNGDIMWLPNSNATVKVAAGGSTSVVFKPMIPLNSKIGEFKVNIDINDSKQPNIRYYSNGYNCSFTTPICYSFFFNSIIDTPKTNCWMMVDGITYHNCNAKIFYWYLGTNHTITVPSFINASSSSEWPSVEWHLSQAQQSEQIKLTGPDHNTFYLNVTAYGQTVIPIDYDAF